MGQLRDYVPALKYGHKIMPFDIAGMVGQPHVGNVFYVDANNGSDSSGGKSWEDAFATLSAAEDACTTNNYDVIIVAPNGTSGTSETATITWDKNHITVVGAAAPVAMSQRSRVIWTTDSVDPCLNVTGHGNRFINLQLATYQASNDVLVAITGDRNYFGNCHLAGIGHETAGDDATARCVSLSGAEENVFDGCVIGLDTVACSAANASVELASASNRNIFRDCLFPKFADNAGALFVKAASAGDIDRWVLFQRCMFHNAVYSTASTMTVGMSIHAAVGGTVILDGCSVLGVIDWSSDYTAVRGCNMPDITAANAGFMETIAT